MRSPDARSHPSHARHLAVRVRLSAVAAIVAVMSVLGSGVAWAAWTASDSASSTAGAATVGVTRSVAGSSLALTYSSSVTAGVAAVTITSTSSRAGTYSLAVSATSASATLRAAVTVQIGTTASCTVSATLASPTNGTLATTTTATGTLAAGASITLCVRTSMTTAAIAANGGASLAGTIATGITVGTWSATAATTTFAQSVAASGPNLEDGARYNILNANQCIAGKDGKVVRNNICDFNNMGQFRITDAGNGNSYISAAMNAAQQPTAPRWSMPSTTGELATVAPVSSGAQQWLIVARPDGLFRFQNVQHGTCATVGTEQLWGSSGGLKLVGATCNDSLATQGFRFTLTDPPTLPPATLACTGNGSNYIQYGWTMLTGYQAEVTYQVWVNGIFVKNYTNGYHPFVQLSPSDLPAASFPAGTYTLEVRQSVAGGPWNATGTRGIVIASNRNMACG